MARAKYTMNDLKHKRMVALTAARTNKQKAETAFASDDLSKFMSHMASFENSMNDYTEMDKKIDKMSKEQGMDNIKNELEDELKDTEREQSYDHNYNKAFAEYLANPNMDVTRIKDTYGEEIYDHMFTKDEVQNAVGHSVQGNNAPLLPEVTQRSLDKVMSLFGGLMESATIRRTRHGRRLDYPMFNRPKRDRTLTTLYQTVAGGAGKSRRALMKERLHAKMQLNLNVDAPNIKDTEEVVTQEYHIHSHGNSSGIARIPFRLNRDSIIDFSMLVLDVLGEDLAQLMALKHMYSSPATLNDTSAVPQGFIDYLLRAPYDNRADYADIKLVKPYYLKGIVDGTAKTWYLVWQDIWWLMQTVQANYRNAPGARYFMSDNIKSIIATMTNDRNEPMLIPSVREGMPDRILGKPYSIGYSIDELAPTTQTDDGVEFVMGYGDLTKIIRRIVEGYRLFRGNTVIPGTGNDNANISDTFRNMQNAFFIYNEEDTIIRPHPAFAAMLVHGDRSGGAGVKTTGSYPEQLSDADIKKFGRRVMYSANTG